MRTSAPRQTGFTLVEIAIVLVIIGLLLGGILKGQEMIVQAKIKNTISDFNGLLVAYNGYVDRYRKLPGDDLDAATRWGAGAATPGNGDSVVSGAYNAPANPLPAAPGESLLFWQHLRLAGFVPGSGLPQPQNAHNGIVGVQTGNGAGAVALGGFSGLIICSSQVPDKVAIAVDNQSDDGVASTGQVRAALQPAPAGAFPTTAPSPYSEVSGTNIYLLCRTV